ncbi:MAG: cyclodeaminase/cyclohydrolase family protein [Anaerolineales bacterium]|nr:cyclodeaminase/cyclohydrolase family protein [Anaerolineales bacterium]MCB9127018.1 cyclodeaminase/cyclohydrolase family protein [Ardenticatenales bacterium]
MNNLRDQAIGDFLDELAGKAATPGGGAAAGVGGAMGAALLSMVANLTIGRKKYAEVEGQMRAILARTEAIRAEMTNLAQLDQHVFERVMAAYKMPKESDSQQSSRNAAIQNALMDATQVPLKIAAQARELLGFGPTLAAKGNRNAISDVGVGILMAEAALNGALMNVAINLGMIDDEAFVAGIDKEVMALHEGRSQLREETLTAVNAALR